MPLPAVTPIAYAWIVGALAIGFPIAWALLRFGWQGFGIQGIPWSASRRLTGLLWRIAGGIVVLIGLAVGAESVARILGGVSLYNEDQKQEREARQQRQKNDPHASNMFRIFVNGRQRSFLGNGQGFRRRC